MSLNISKSILIKKEDKLPIFLLILQLKIKPKKIKNEWSRSINIK